MGELEIGETTDYHNGSKGLINMAFTRMDQGKVEEWMIIGEQVMKRQAGMPAIIIKMLTQLEEQVDGFAVDQLQHGLQTATRAVRDGSPALKLLTLRS